MPLIFCGVVAVLATQSGASDASDRNAKVLETRDLVTVAAESKSRRLPVLVMFSAKHCGYCQRLEEEFLRPMLISGEYEDRVIIRKVMVDSFASIRDFKGEKIDAGRFADRYNVDVTPTVMLFDAEGRMLARRLIGLNNVDFYGAFLERAINNAYGKLNRTDS